MKLAGIDIGTLTCRLLIAEVEADGRFSPQYADRRILRLGEGVDRDKCLQPDAMVRVIDTLREWHAVIRAHDVAGCVVVGTSAIRDASNRQEFLERIQQETGMTVEVLDGREEARRTLLGLSIGIDSSMDRLLGLDIGGGSTEFILAQQGKDPRVASIDIGVVRLTERLLHHDPPTATELAEARSLITHMTQQAVSSFPITQDMTFLGTAGTITTLAAMAQGLTRYDPKRIHHYLLPLSTVCDLETTLLSRTSEERRAMPGLEPGRETVIVAGTLILRSIMEHLCFHACLVSEYGLREGILVDLAARLNESHNSQ